MIDAPIDPKKTHALVVGIEKYDAGDKWNKLRGPVADAVAFCQWLHDRNVPPKQIQLFLSLEDDSKAQIDKLPSEIDHDRSATSTEIDKAIEKLAKVAADLIIIFWAGHGVTHREDDHTGHRLFFADATIEQKRNLYLDNLLASFKTSAFANCRRQIVIVDACSLHEEDLQYAGIPTSKRPLGRSKKNSQFVFLAARPGQPAKNLGLQGRGLFSTHVIDAMSDSELLDSILSDPPNAPRWLPDMKRVTDRVKDELDALRKQDSSIPEPYFQMTDWDDSTKIQPPSLPAEAFALVIGVGNHDNGISVKPGRPGEVISYPQDKFLNLRCARNDAEKFAEFLGKKELQSKDWQVSKLVDKDATLRSIRVGLENLRKECEESKANGCAPIALIFFSGHGTVDYKGRNYLVPSDADRNMLRATALWDKELTGFLAELQQETTQLVFLLDACHAGGMTTKDGSKSANIGYQYGDVQSACPYFIASCEAGQESWESEHDENSIFTSELLRILRFDESEDQEEIELSQLAATLKRTVREAAKDKLGKLQVPCISIAREHRIILAKNPQGGKRKSDFLLLIQPKLRKLAISQLQNYIKLKAKMTRYELFLDGCVVFDEAFRYWNPKKQITPTFVSTFVTPIDDAFDKCLQAAANDDPEPEAISGPADGFSSQSGSSIRVSEKNRKDAATSQINLRESD
ncbi:hypothetical protein G5V57_05315 [Nordella sp. HKS 07]|uniref:caspase family protein n=1 Tax=Nordella sp. HKS 07 TaxID=2712222 RepID=UPI0013E1D959|nr:caspase family protein [Nordella sp. HKS 07]QIG47203.1 hypothetical protein G5V57_05315 [Nordella sp. HKS 07]